MTAGLDAGQLAELAGRLEHEAGRCDALRGINPVYAAEANAYRRVLSTLEELTGQNTVKACLTQCVKHALLCP